MKKLSLLMLAFAFATSMSAQICYIAGQAVYNVNTPVTLGSGSAYVSSNAWNAITIHFENISYTGAEALLKITNNSVRYVNMDFYGTNVYRNNGTTNHGIDFTGQTLNIRGEQNTTRPTPSLTMSMEGAGSTKRIATVNGNVWFMNNAADKTFTINMQNTVGNSGLFFKGYGGWMEVDNGVDLTISVNGGDANSYPVVSSDELLCTSTIELEEGMYEVNGAEWAVQSTTGNFMKNGKTPSTVHFADYYNLPVKIGGTQITSKTSSRQVNFASGQANLTVWNESTKNMVIWLFHLEDAVNAPLIQITDSIQTLSIYADGENTYDVIGTGFAFDLNYAANTTIYGNEGANGAPSLTLNSHGTATIRSQKLTFRNNATSHFNVALNNDQAYGIMFDSQLTINSNLTLDVNASNAPTCIMSYRPSATVTLASGVQEINGAVWQNSEFEKDGVAVKHVTISDRITYPILINEVQVDNTNCADVPYEDGKVGTVSVTRTVRAGVPNYNVTLSDVETVTSNWFIRPLASSENYTLTVTIDGFNQIDGNLLQSVVGVNSVMIKDNGGDADSLYCNGAIWAINELTFIARGHLAIELDRPNTNNYLLKANTISVTPYVSLYATNKPGNGLAAVYATTLDLSTGVVEAYGSKLDAASKQLKRAGRPAHKVYFDGEDRAVFYDLSVTGVNVTNYNSEDVINDGGTVTFSTDQEGTEGYQGILELNNASGVGTIRTDNDYEIALRGDNEIAQINANGNLHIYGATSDATLLVYCTNTEAAYAVRVNGGTLSIQDCTLDVESVLSTELQAVIYGNNNSSISTDNALVSASTVGAAAIKGFNAFTIGEGYKFEGNYEFSAAQKGVVNTGTTTFATDVRVVKDSIVTAVENAAVESNATSKRIVNGQLIIEREGKSYNAMGATL